MTIRPINYYISMYDFLVQQRPLYLFRTCVESSELIVKPFTTMLKFLISDIDAENLEPSVVSEECILFQSPWGSISSLQMPFLFLLTCSIILLCISSNTCFFCTSIKIEKAGVIGYLKIASSHYVHL